MDFSIADNTRELLDRISDFVQTGTVMGLDTSFLEEIARPAFVPDRSERE